MLNSAQTDILSVLIQIASFASSFAGIAAGIIMSNVTRKFGTGGILAHGSRSITIGIVFIAFGITTDSLANYMLVFNNPTINTILLILKEAFFVVGTYVIVIGSKRTADKLKTLTKQ